MQKPLIIITGASSGIGAAIAKAFSQAGYPLGLMARNIKAMQDLKLPHSLCLELDVTDANAFKKAVAQAEAEFGPTDCLVNNAGVGIGGDFTELSHSDHEKMVQVNVMGVINGCEAVLPDMQKRQSGTIVNVSSVADRSSRPTLATYAATKAAVKSLSESLRAANAKYGIRICNLAPAKIKTPLLMKSNLSQDQLIEVEDVAKAVLWIYEQPKTLCVRDIVMAPTFYEA